MADFSAAGAVPQGDSSFPLAHPGYPSDSAPPAAPAAPLMSGLLGSLDALAGRLALPLEVSRTKAARFARMEARVAANPLDSEAWTMMVGEVIAASPAEFRPVFEACVKHFPDAGCLWRQWIDAELRAGEVVQAEQLFERCLLRCPHLELWKLYLRYLRERQTPPAELAQALQLLLQAVGEDINAGPLWLEHVALCRDVIEPGMMQQGAQVSEARSAFQQALVQPVVGLDGLMQEYENWEVRMSGGAPAARQLMADVTEKALVARRVARERKSIWDQLSIDQMPPLPRGHPAEGVLLAKWRRLWQHEATNMQRLPPQQLQARMQFTFKQALMVCWLMPQAWHEAASWMAEHGYVDSARALYTRAVEVLPNSDLLVVAFARFEERSDNASGARALYERLVERSPSSINFIQLMRFARRAEGLWQARNVFARARRQPSCSWHVYAVAAKLEYHLASCDRSEGQGAAIASRILAKAFERYHAEPMFVLSYLRFLESQREHNTMRAVLERALSSSNSLELWNAYVELECSWGDISTVEAVETRRREALPDLSLRQEGGPTSLAEMAVRQGFEDLIPGGDEAALAIHQLHTAPHTRLIAPANRTRLGRGGRRGGALVTPLLSQCVEYTGQTLGQPGAVQAAALSNAGLSNEPPPPAAVGLGTVPLELIELLSLLPKAAVAGVTPAEIRRLVARLAHFPEEASGLPVACAALAGGSCSGSTAGAQGVKREQGDGAEATLAPRPSSDIYTARKKLKPA
ncbi:hypothetical protein AB1Y20_010169 [Prymnesium parvum]|uniref:Suppressor of forked domain-containing protein n=1 Tax=Prymnesium parvum TaxID=97485 RepID=A0AB34K3P8_PRYPA